jgi:translation elongation factor EF-4
VRALVFDSEYDTFRGGIIYVRMFDGAIRRGDRIRMMGAGKDFEVQEVGLFNPKPQPTEALQAGQVGYFLANIKNTSEILIGDTITSARNPTAHPLTGFKAMHPMVFTGLYPIDADDYEKLKYALEKLSLNDSSFQYTTESSVALGFGFRCGFLGLLHMEIVQERLRREYVKSVSRGYASFDYKFLRFDPGALVKLDILINKERVDAMSMVVHRQFAERRGRQLVETLREVIPRQQFEVAIQAAIGGQILARSTVKAYRKDVTAKLYGGDVTRKRKLLEKQKAGKRRMKQIGTVEIPQEAFLAVLQGEKK